MRIASLTLVLFASALAAQTPGEPLRLPKEPSGIVEQAIEIHAETMGKAVRFRAVDPGIILLWDMPDLKREKKAIAIACKPGRYRVEAWTSFNDEPSKIYMTTVVVHGQIPPPEPPGPLPPPIPPVDPLTAKLQAAYTLDTGTVAEKTAQRTAMIGLYLAMADHTADKGITKLGDLLGDYRKVAASLAPGVLVNTRKAVAAEVTAVFGASEAAILDDPMRARGVDLFRRLAKSMGELK